MPSSDEKNKGKRREIPVDDGTSWEAPINELRHIQQIIRTPNPSDPGYIRQKKQGKLWVRERLDLLLDKGSFQEVGSVTGKPNVDKDGKLIGFTPANSVIGWGKIRSRKVFVAADDFSVRGGHADGGIHGKAPYGETLARKARVPLIRLLDGSSGGGSVALYLTMGATYVPGLAGLGRSMDTMAVVPVASALLGPVVGLAAAKAALSHFSVMVHGLSQLFAAGPPVVVQATFENLSKEALGGVQVHATNGTVDNVAASEADALRQIRHFLSYMPSNIFQLPPVIPSRDSTDRREEELISIIPRRRGRGYDIRKLIRLIVDIETEDTLAGNGTGSSFFEIGATWGRCIITGLCRLGGRTVGILSSDCMANGGAIDALGSQKTTRFANLCEHFGIPLLNFVDQPGFSIGSIAEKTATIRHGAAAMSALYSATAPIFTIILRRAFGVAGSAFTDPDDGLGLRVAWPSGDWGSLPLEGGIEAAYKRQLDEAVNPEAREELMRKLLGQFEEVRSPVKTAHQFGIEEIIDPRDTRKLVCEWAAHAYEHMLPQLSIVRQSRYGFDGTLSANRGYKL
ncbi:hypothetical protein M422DRAFT_226466 [Sphaerobolus stellatus SS14]|nr:hypothetical protein M422DRAFT_226466 [Sphaerobolus stellatus SS14]